MMCLFVLFAAHARAEAPRKHYSGFLHFWRPTTAKTTREKQERLVGLEAAQQKEAEPG